MASQMTPPSPNQLQALLDGPAGKPPAGVITDFQHSANLNTAVVLSATLCIMIPALAVLMRMYTKVFLIKSTTYEDYALLIGWMSQITEIVVASLTVRYGSGAHMWNIRLGAFSNLLYWVNITSIVYELAVFFIKLSILLQYLRIFVPSRNGNLVLYVGIHVCIWSNFVYDLAHVIFMIALCSPREKIWEPWLQTGHCLNANALYLASGFFNIISDFAILFLPMPCLWKLQAPLKKKIFLTTIFAAGLLACVTSIVRTYYTFRVVQLPDISFNLAVMGLCASTELAIGTIISCLPVLPRFFQRFGPKVCRIFSFTSKSENKSTPKLASTGRYKATRLSFAQKPPFSKRRTGSSTSELWNGPFNPHAELNSAYTPPSECSPGQLESGVFNGINKTPSVRSTGLRQDHLESAGTEDAIEMVRYTY